VEGVKGRGAVKTARKGTTKLVEGLTAQILTSTFRRKKKKKKKAGLLA
jgi:hypothetical protein